MRENRESTFLRFESGELPVGIFDRIMVRMHREEFRRARRRLAVFGVSILISGSACVWITDFLRIEFIQSGFVRLLALSFSDLGFMAADWQDFGLALAESLPTIATAMFLSAVFLFLWSLRSFVWVTNWSQGAVKFN